MPTIRHEGLPKQLEFWRSDARIRAFIGGLGSGKTRAGAIEILRQPAGSLGIVVAPTYRVLQDATQRTFLERCHKAQDAGVKLIAAHHEARQETRLVNGTTILWRSATEPDRLRGINAGWAWVDEAASIDHEVWLVLLGRLRRAPERAWITTTPVGAQHWTAKLEAEGAQKGADAGLKRAKTAETMVKAQVLAETPIEDPNAGAGGNPELEMAQAEHEADLSEREFEHKRQIDFAKLNLQRRTDDTKLMMQAQDMAAKRADKREIETKKAAAAAQRPTATKKG
jgi:hypothetical protein